MNESGSALLMTEKTKSSAIDGDDGEALPARRAYSVRCGAASFIVIPADRLAPGTTSSNPQARVVHACGAPALPRGDSATV